MKTLYQLGFALIFTILITACSENNTEVTEHNASNAPTQNMPTTLPKFSDQDIETSVYELQQPGITVRITLIGQNDKVLSQQIDSYISYEKFGANNATEAKLILSQLPTIDYNSIDGMNYNITYGDKGTQETILLDLTKVDLSQLAELPGAIFNGNSKHPISYSATNQLLENSGFKKIQ